MRRGSVVAGLLLTLATAGCAFPQRVSTDDDVATWVFSTAALDGVPAGGFGPTWRYALPS